MRKVVVEWIRYLSRSEGGRAAARVPEVRRDGLSAWSRTSRKAKGGLRDLHLLQWVGLARFQAPTIRELSDRGILSKPIIAAIKEARDFLLRVRSLLHMRAGMAQEILTFDEQVWLAEATRVSRPAASCSRSSSSCSNTIGIRWGCMRPVMRFVERCRRVARCGSVSFDGLPSPRIDNILSLTARSLTVAG